ncbi:hypothetical protein [Sphingobium sp. sgz301303]
MSGGRAVGHAFCRFARIGGITRGRRDAAATLGIGSQLIPSFADDKDNPPIRFAARFAKAEGVTG